MPLIDVPFKRVAIDLVGPFSPSSQGHRYVLTIVDTATRYPEAIPLKKTDTVSVAEALLTVFSRVGLPEEILSDCGTQFVSDLMKEIYRLLSVKSVTTTPYHPQSNGMVERFNGTLKVMLRKMTREQPKEWDRYIPALLFAYRELPNETLGFSPFELVFGRSPRGIIDVVAQNWSGQNSQDMQSTVYQYIFELQNRIRDTCQAAQKMASNKTDAYKQYADRKAKARFLSAGDEVLVLLTEEKNKLRLLWKGPFTVIKKMSPVNFCIDMNGVQKVLHINMLKKYVRRTNVAVNMTVECDTDVSTKDDVDMSEILSPEFVPDALYRERGEKVQEAERMESARRVCQANVGVMSEGEEEGYKVLPTLSVKGENVNDVVIDDTLSDQQKNELTEILTDFADILTDKPGKATGIEPHSIHLVSEKPVRVKPYPLPFSKRAVVEKEIQSMLELGVIEQSVSAYTAPMVLVQKPDGSVRFCIDYRELNKVTVFDAEPIPDIEEILSQISQGKYFVKIDLTKGYWQIPMHPKDKDKTAFQTPLGLYQWTRMPFGLQNAPATFARMMRGLKLHECGAVSFFDDILLAKEEWGQLLQALRAILHRLRGVGLTVRPSKMKAGFRTLEFLGHMISVGKMFPETSKVEKILALKQPTTKKQVRSILGLLSYYRRYVKNFAMLTTPLTNLTKGEKTRRIEWSGECQTALEKVQKILNSYPVLLLPTLTEDFVLRTDASSQGMGAVLLQEKNGILHPVQYASKKFTETQKHYSTVERECLATVWGCEKFARFLVGREFVLQTDHRPLTFLKSSKTKNNRLLRWALRLQEFKFRIEHLPGNRNILADLLSREDR